LAEIILFGGTSEGRQIAESLYNNGIDALVCIATDYGKTLLPKGLRTNAGRLSLAEIKRLFAEEHPRTIIDATHPYAAQISENISAASGDARYIRVKREHSKTDGCVKFSDIHELVKWLNKRDGVIFSTLGAKEAPTFANFKERTWLRILPDLNSLKTCLDAGFQPKHVICMQGTFSRELNTAMFKASGANILLTKESGAAGGFAEKIEAARDCGMTIAVLARPQDENGLTLSETIKLIEDREL